MFFARSPPIAERPRPTTAPRNTTAGRLERGELPAPGHGRPPGGRHAADAQEQQRGGEEPRLGTRHEHPADDPHQCQRAPARRWPRRPAASADGSISSLNSPASMKWIGTTIRVVTSIICPARVGPPADQAPSQRGEEDRPDQGQRALARRLPEESARAAGAPRRSS